MRKLTCCIGVLGAFATLGGPALAADVTGPSGSDPPYIVRSQSGVVTKSILTVGDTPTGSTYRMAGIPDGMGAYDNGDGTFTVLMNHEIRETAEAIRGGRIAEMWMICAAPAGSESFWE